ncbi:MAG TPA: hypothetical protein VFY65_14500 [Longimicrobium sp.]|nr:hypothetical protein [Longimicrobium sp.]
MLTTRRSAFRSTRGKSAIALMVLAAALASCTNVLEPPVNEQSTPFYYYENEKIYLRVDPLLLTAVPKVEGDTATLRAVLARAGVPADSIRPLWVPGHWFVHLPARTSARHAEDAARELRLDAGVRFASAVYRLRDDGDCPLYLVNRLVVQFREGTGAAAIDRLNAALGIRNERLELSSGTRAYEYPEQLAPTPLELAAYYHVQDVVDWAEPDRVDGCLRPGA